VTATTFLFFRSVKNMSFCFFSFHRKVYTRNKLLSFFQNIKNIFVSNTKCQLNTFRYETAFKLYTSTTLETQNLWPLLRGSFFGPKGGRYIQVCNKRKFWISSGIWGTYLYWGIWNYVPTVEIIFCSNLTKFQAKLRS